MNHLKSTSMKKLTLLLTAALVFSAGFTFAQKLKSGDLTVLKGQTALSIKYDYSKMAVGKFKNSDEYVADGIADRNKKKPGSGEIWAASWKADRTEQFQPAFERELNGELKSYNLVAKENDSDAKYTLIVYTTFLEPGFQSGVGVSKAATINLEVDLVETSAMETVLAKIVYDKVPSANMMGYDYDAGKRIESCYDRAGGNIGKLIEKNGLKK
jgi:hypothetical protein